MPQLPLTQGAPGAAAQLRSRHSQRGADAGYRAIVAVLFSVVMLLSVATMAWSIAGLPVRAIAATGLLGLLVAVDRQTAEVALRKHRSLLLLTFGIGLLGAVVSLLNGMSGANLFIQIAQIHIQTAVNLLLGAMVAEICGGSAVILIFIGSVAVSALFACAQFFSIEAAWTFRDAIARVTHEVVKYDRARAPGLSLSVITLATQLCLALAGIVVRQQRMSEAAGVPRRFDPVVPVAVFLFSLACLAGGNRSPILGGALFLALYSATRAPRAFLLISPFVVLAIPLAALTFDALQGTGLRAFTTGDKSSEGRETLFYYGLRLFLDRPIGYGLGFDSTRYWGEYWEFLIRFPDPMVVRAFELHNYVLNMLNYYGIGLLMFLPWAFKLLARNKTLLLAFLPYCIHIVFHNYGPFANDTWIFFIIAAAGARMTLKFNR